MTAGAAYRAFPADVADALADRLEEARRQGIAARLVDGDPHLWPAPAVARGRLGWLCLPATMREDLADLAALAREAREEGVRDVVVLGMGGSSLAAEVFAALLGGRRDRPRVSVLDSTHPAAVAAYRDAFPPTSSWYVVASKSGTTIETEAFERTFWSVAGPDGAGERFLAVTDADSALADLAGRRGYRRLLLAPEDVGGRFSALSHFGLLPGALLGADPAVLLDGAAAILDEPDDAIELGLLLGEAARAGRDKLTLLPQPELAPFVPWLEQLIAESTGKQGCGLVPVSGEPEGAHLGGDRLFVRLSLAGADEADWGRARLEEAGHPVVELRWPGEEAVGAEMMRWEIATAIAAAVLEVQAFDQPDVDLAKREARRAMSEGSAPRPTDPPVIAAEEGEALQTALTAWLDGAAPGDYIALQAFLPPAPEVLETIGSLRTNLAATGLPTTLGFGPRFLHSTGQLHKGGPSGAFCLQLIDSGGDDLAVPGADYSYRQLIDAQALGDARALAARGRRVLRVRLGD